MNLIGEGAASFVAALEGDVLEGVVAEVNSDFALPFMSKLPNEPLPTNERNLTDVRTRIGVLLEYSFALALDERIRADHPDDARMAFVVANRYPDLAIRDRSMQPALRIEVKSLQLVSEEKSANFDALLREIHPKRDVLSILVWEWQRAEINGVDVDYPEIRRAFVFEAYPIALARDLGWLGLGSVAKGIDVAGPVVGDGSSWREEEHNMGKVLRILSEQSEVPSVLATNPNVLAYQEFRVFALSAGLAFRAASELQQLGIVCPEPTDYVHDAGKVGIIAQGQSPDTGREVLVAAAGRLTQSVLAGFSETLSSAATPPDCVVIFSDKFKWRLYEFDGTELAEVDRGDKPGPLRPALASHLAKEG